MSEECDPEQRCNPSEDRGEGKRRDTDCFVNGHFFSTGFFYDETMTEAHPTEPPLCCCSGIWLWAQTHGRIRPRTHTGQEGTSCSSPALFPEHARTSPSAPRSQTDKRLFSPYMLSRSLSVSLGFFCFFFLYFRSSQTVQALSRIVWDLWCVCFNEKKIFWSDLSYWTGGRKCC